MTKETAINREARQRGEKFLLQKEKIEALKKVNDKSEISKIRETFAKAVQQMQMRHLLEFVFDSTKEN
ncbi:MAG: hypothetical protein WDN26_16500 [Chitinophagaceae bacterium]